MNKEEIWKAIDGYDGYEISSLGRVKSLKYGKERILKPQNDRNGYLYVNLCKDGKRKMFYVHRLVATAFLPNPYDFEQVNHKDENKINNCANNLEFCTPKYNSNYGSRNERISKVVEASRFSDFRTIEHRFASTQEAERNGFTHSAVSACCRRCYYYEGNNKFKGLFWRFAI